jgi:LysM repeat protein
MVKKYLENSTEIPKISTAPTTPSTPKISEITNVTNVKIKAGDVVKIAENAVYYSGQSIPGWVKNQNWIVKEIKGDRAVIDKNQSGTNNICSPVNVKFLTVITTSSPTPNYEIYTVVKGDSLWKIATNKLGNGKRYTEIKSLNGLSNDTIIAGQKLKIPKK